MYDLNFSGKDFHLNSGFMDTQLLIAVGGRRGGANLLALCPAQHKLQIPYAHCIITFFFNQLEVLKSHGVTHIACIRQSNEAHFVKPNFPDHFK